jgi:(p)ppGpp synthase/HD superfamily hydrolase
MQKVFGRTVTRYVKAVTKDPKQGYLGRLKRCAEWQVLVIKLADRIHNLETLDAFTPEKQERYRQETRRYFYHLADRLIILLPKKQKRLGILMRNDLKKLCPPA